MLQNGVGPLWCALGIHRSSHAMLHAFNRSISLSHSLLRRAGLDCGWAARRGWERALTCRSGSRRECAAAASAGDTNAPTPMMADDVPPGAPTVLSAGPLLPCTAPQPLGSQSAQLRSVVGSPTWVFRGGEDGSLEQPSWAARCGHIHGRAALPRLRKSTRVKPFTYARWGSGAHGGRDEGDVVLVHELLGERHEAAVVVERGGLAVRHVDEVAAAPQHRRQRARQPHARLQPAQPVVADLAADIASSKRRALEADPMNDRPSHTTPFEIWS